MARMPDKRTPTGKHSLDVDALVYERLNWLISANLRQAAHRRRFPNPDDEEQVLFMRHPVPTARAYAHFGMLLGALPPAALLYRFYDYVASLNFLATDDLLFFFLLMNLLCILVGRKAGARIGRTVDEIERTSWSRMLLVAALEGLGWALVTGAAGGILFYGVGALFGAALTMPVGALAFVLFTALHRLLARGGMIDARHFWPLACGVSAFVAALLLPK